VINGALAGSGELQFADGGRETAATPTLQGINLYGLTAEEIKIVEGT